MSKVSHDSAPGQTVPGQTEPRPWWRRVIMPLLVSGAALVTAFLVTFGEAVGRSFARSLARLLGL
jgi:hypothetical protein